MCDLNSVDWAVEQQTKPEQGMRARNKCGLKGMSLQVSGSNEHTNLENSRKYS